MEGKDGGSLLFMPMAHSEVRVMDGLVLDVGGVACWLSSQGKSTKESGGQGGEVNNKAWLR